MEPLMNEQDKKLVASFIPYCRKGDKYQFFLQKRTADAPTNPGMFGMFGGGMEMGETPEEAFFREIEEELVYKPENPRYFSRYENVNRIFHVFIEEVGTDFESQVKVLEGDYGKFMSSEEIKNLDQITLLSKLVFSQLNDFLIKE